MLFDIIWIPSKDAVNCIDFKIFFKDWILKTQWQAKLAVLASTIVLTQQILIKR